MKRILVLFILSLTLVGCSSTNSGNDLGVSSNNKATRGEASKDLADNFVFEYNGISIAIDDEAEAILEELGEPMEYFEAPSCAYQGLDKTYYYNGFEITTYTQDDTDYIANVVLVDDSVTTKEGIHIGSSIDQ